MQPLYSVDHESRHSTNHAEDHNEPERPSENSPLLLHFSDSPTTRNPVTMLTVSLLLLILIAGVIIGIYLLVLQKNSLPPVDLPLQLVSRSQWDQSNLSQTVQNMSPYKLYQVIAVHTNTRECVDTATCTKLLQEMQTKAAASKCTIPYNFLISTNGQTYEALGWLKLSPMLTQKPSRGLVLAFIGNFTSVSPSLLQMLEAKTFFAESVSHRYLHPSYRIMGKNFIDTPVYLSLQLAEFPQWNSEFSDTKI